MDTVSLKASARPAVKPAALRRTGSVPCVIYGTTLKENVNVACKQFDLHRAFVKAGESTIVDLDLEGKHIPVLFKDISFDPVSGLEVHVDFYAVDMKKEIETIVPVHFEGEAPAVKTLAAIFVTSQDHVRVRCLPSDLPHALSVSITTLENFHDTVAVKDLDVPKGVTVMEKPDAVLATVQEPRTEEEIAPPPAAVPAEGEAAAPGTEEAGAEGTPAATAEPAAAAPQKEKAPKEKK